MLNAFLLTSHWAAEARRRALEKAASSLPNKDALLLFLCDLVMRQQTELDILRKRLRQPGKKPRYTPHERLHILWHMDYFQIPRSRVRQHFGIARSTLYRWLHRVEDKHGPNKPPANKSPTELARLIWDIAKANPQWGRHRVAMQVWLLKVFVTASTVRNILTRPMPKPTPGKTEGQNADPMAKKSPKLIIARHPNHVWSVDLTTVRLWGIWPVNVLVAIDHFSRRLLYTQPLKRAQARCVIAALKRCFTKFGNPKHLVSDQGVPFKSDAVSRLLQRRKTKHRFGAIGQHGSIAVTERVIETLKYEWLKRVPIIRGFDHLEQLCDSFAVWYNEWRPHTFLDGATPTVVFEEQPWERPEKNSKQLPPNIERIQFADTRVVAFRLAQPA
jgi:transposase InsO family protein